MIARSLMFLGLATALVGVVPRAAAAATWPDQQIPPRDRQTPQALGALHRAAIEKWWPIIKAANIKAD